MSAGAQELIQNTFSPLVGVLCSPTVEALAHKNNLTFVELLQPFCRLSCEGFVKDPGGGHCRVRNLKVTICNINTRPPQPVLARKFLNESVNMSTPEKTANLQFGHYKVDIPVSTPWFESWRDTFFHVQFPADHEYLKHFLGCMLVVSTLDPNPVEILAHMADQLIQMQNVSSQKLPKFFNNDALRCCILVHDALEGSIEKAQKTYEVIRYTYGYDNCFFLSINSRNPSDTEGALPDPWSKYLLRKPEYAESTSEKDSLPRTPADMTAVSSMPVTLETPDGSTGVESGGDGGAVTVQIHPLSPSEEADVNSFQNTSGQSDSLTSSVEGDVPIINPNVWEPTSANGGMVHGGSLTTQDIENIKTFLQEFTLKALLPYLERLILQLQDAVSNKKGVSRSLLSATKRWFGTNKPGTNAPVNSVVYSGDCPELQLRRLADIWFMLGQWGNAFQAYHTAKREYSADGAWMLYAGALEMAALSAFMANEATRKTLDYMEESIVTYMNSCRMPQFAVRATLFSIQCLTNRGLHGEAAKQLIRMTSEDCDLRSALLLEQAALCFLAGPPRKALVRKYAFHMVLAGHRYSKAGQRKHSLRCYRQAYQVYGGGGWRLATDHIEFAVGRLAGQVKGCWADAAGALASLLAPRSLQSPPQQAAFLREYLHVRQQWLLNVPDQQNQLPILPVPVLDGNSTIVLCGGANSATISSGEISTNSSNSPLWATLEEMLLHKNKGTAPMLFKPSLSLFNCTSDNSSNPVVPQGESIQLMVHLQNPLLIDITITDLQLLWQFRSLTSSESGSDAETFFSNESCVTAQREYDKSIVITQKVQSLVLLCDKVTTVTLNLTPLHPGELIIVGVAYRLCNSTSTKEESPGDRLSVLGKQVFEIRGPKLKNAKDIAGEPQYGVDKRLNINVVTTAPCLQASFSEIGSNLLSGEIQRITVEIRNIGRVGLNNLYLGTSHPQFLCLDADSGNPFSPLLETCYWKIPQDLVSDERQIRLEKEKRLRNRHCLKVLDHLGAGQTHSMVLWIRAPQRTGLHTLYALFYYEHADPNGLPKHRLLRKSWTISVLDSVQLSAVARRSLRPNNNNKEKYVEALNIAMEVRNCNQIHHGVLTLIEMQQVSLLSQCWSLDGYVPVHQNIKVLSSQENLLLIMKARRSATSDKNEEIVSSDVRLDLNSNEMVPVSQKPFCYFISDYAAVLDNEEMNNDTALSEEAFHADSKSVNSTLVVRWKADVTESGGVRRVACGQHYLILDKLDNKISTVISNDPLSAVNSLPIKLFGADVVMDGSVTIPRQNSLEYEERLVTYCLEHQLNVSHDFTKCKICIVGVKMHLVNCSTKDLVAVIYTSSHKSFKLPGICWVGAGGNENGSIQISLPALESQSIPLQVACTFPGTYSLGGTLRVSCKIINSSGESRTILQGHIASSTLIVCQT